MARRPTQTAPQTPALLIKPRSEARAQLVARQDAGKILLQRAESSGERLEILGEDYKKWSQYNSELILRLFTNDEYKKEYDWSSYSAVISMGQRSLSEERTNLVKSISRKLAVLSSLEERLGLIDEAITIRPDSSSMKIEAKTSELSPNIFIVHGHDNDAKTIVASFIRHCGLIPVILHDQADKGRTIIEKFEQTADVGFAVVLLTPDDIGAALRDNATSVSDMKMRARQNVILELGYFIGRLGRSHVCALKKGDPEIPSDFGGVVYTPFASDELWKVKLMRELKAAGYNIDANVVFA